MIKTITPNLREQVYYKYAGRCAYSGTILMADWQVDHMVPKVLYRDKYSTEDPNDISNLMPVQRIVNHYKGSLLLSEFKSWYLGGLHERLRKLPKHPRVPKSIRHKAYLLEVAALFGITPTKPFEGQLYFEMIQMATPL